jgi:hypothetical protein
VDIPKRLTKGEPMPLGTAESQPFRLRHNGMVESAFTTSKRDTAFGRTNLEPVRAHYGTRTVACLPFSITLTTSSLTGERLSTV